MTEPLALVTGATGMVGAAIVRALLGRRCRVRVLARDPERARSLWGSAVEVLAGDLRAPASLVRACQGVSDLYHAAALVGDGPETALRETNVEGTRHLLRAARASGVARIAFTSSVSVYGDGLRPGVAEDAPLAPQSAYGLSKVEAEEAVREIARDGVHAVILRPCIVYGPGDRYFTPQLLSAVRFPVLPLPDGEGTSWTSCTRTTWPPRTSWRSSGGSRVRPTTSPTGVATPCARSSGGERRLRDGPRGVPPSPGGPPGSCCPGSASWAGS